MGQEGRLRGQLGEYIAILSRSEAMVVCTGAVEFETERSGQFQTIVWKQNQWECISLACTIRTLAINGFLGNCSFSESGSGLLMSHLQ